MAEENKGMTLVIIGIVVIVAVVGLVLFFSGARKLGTTGAVSEQSSCESVCSGAKEFCSALTIEKLTGSEDKSIIQSFFDRCRAEGANIRGCLNPEGPAIACVR